MNLYEPAPAKINLSLFLGPVRSDGRHELVTLFESVSLRDELELTVLNGGTDQVRCPGVPGPNLVSDALVALREAGWVGPPVGIEIHKRIPVAAGLGGGSADAAAALRLAHALEPVPSTLARQIARALGADVPSQLDQGVALGTGVGDELERLAPLPAHAIVIVPQAFPLATAAVYREADRLALPRRPEELAERRRSLTAALRAGELPGHLVVNDLEPATLSLAPAVAPALDALKQSGADHALVCGSGPTAIGVYWGTEASSRAREGAQELSRRYPGSVFAAPDLPSQ